MRELNYLVYPRKTYNFWRQGRSLEEIATIRNLKVATIEDHFVEIALREKDFSIEMFMEKEKDRQSNKSN